MLLPKCGAHGEAAGASKEIASVLACLRTRITQEAMRGWEGQWWTDLEDVEANAAKAVNIRMVDFCQESYLGGRHRVLLWEEKL